MNELAKMLLKGMTEKNSEIEFKIQANTELHRKGFGRIWLQTADGKPFAGNAEIRLKQISHEYNFGGSLFMLGEFPEPERNAQYETIFADMFNLGVVPLYWRDLEPTQGHLRFDKGSEKIYRRPATDLCVEYGEKHHIRLKGHPLCWNQWLPAWLPKDRREFVRLLERRVAQIAERYADRIFIFDAINEVISAQHHFDCPYPDEGIMQTAFKIAEKYFPHAQLVLNEDRAWWRYVGEHTHFYMLAKELISSGIRPGGLGFQYHSFPQYFSVVDGLSRFSEDYKCFANAENLYRLLDLYGKLDIPCSLTEISIMSRPDMLGDEALTVQKLWTEKLYRLWFSHPATDGIVWWNPIDRTAAGGKIGSLDSENAFQAGLFNYDDFSLKPAGQTVRDLIKKEWHTETTMEFTPGGDNRFHGFYGDYDAEIRTDNGSFKAKITLSKHASTDMVVKMER